MTSSCPTICCRVLESCGGINLASKGVVIGPGVVPVAEEPRGRLAG